MKFGKEPIRVRLQQGLARGEDTVINDKTLKEARWKGWTSCWRVGSVVQITETKEPCLSYTQIRQKLVWCVGAVVA